MLGMMVHFLLVRENILINTEESSLRQHWFIFLLSLDKDIHQLFLVHHLHYAGVHYVAIFQGSGTGLERKEIFTRQGSTYGTEEKSHL